MHAFEDCMKLMNKLRFQRIQQKWGKKQTHE